MITSIERGQLETDFDCRYFSLLNVAALLPIPPGLVGEDDPRLSDQREPLDGSVTNVKVATGAGIVQSKLSLNGVIPPAWLGNTSTTAAQGNLAEYVSRRGAINGYASLDGSGKVPIAQIPSSVGTGTVTSVGLTMPAQFSLTGPNPITGSGTIAVAWASAPATSWFGNRTASAAPPTFNTAANKLPVALIPDLDTSQITTGIFVPARLPIAQYGGGHALGAVPDPGAAVAGTETDYLARDMTYKVTPTSAKVTVLTTTGGGTSFTPDPGLRALFVELWGGGGGGGGVAPAPGASKISCAAGGGGGGYASKWITAIQASYNYIVGSGGVPGTNSGSDGFPGGDTSFMGGPPLAGGGLGGNGDATGGDVPGIVRAGAQGGGGTGDLGVTGGVGGDGVRWDGVHGRSGDGGDGALGGGRSRGRSTDGAGAAGNLYGGGGAGAFTASGTGYSGGAGHQGAIRVTQYF